MNHKQLSAIIAKNFKPAFDIPKNNNIVALKGFNEPETFEWIRKLEFEWKKMQEKADTFHRPESIRFDVLSKNPEVVMEVQIYHGMRTLYENIYDYIYKKETNE